VEGERVEKAEKERIELDRIHISARILANTNAYVVKLQILHKCPSIAGIL